MTYRIIPDPEVSGVKLVSWPETFNLSAVIRLTPSGAPTGRAFYEVASPPSTSTGLLLA